MPSCLETIKLINNNESNLDKGNFIYFIQTGTNGPIKIGWTQFIIKHLNEVKVNNPNEVFIIGIFSGSKTLANEIQNKFKEHKIKGEWYSASNELITFIKEIQEIPEEKIPEILTAWKINLTNKASVEDDPWLGDVKLDRRGFPVKSPRTSL